MIKSEKQKEILHCLLLGERRFADLKELGYNDVTLTRHLKALESDNYISHNHLKKMYKITSKGISLLNKLDNESRGKVFAAGVYYNINHNLRFWYIFDTRIPDDAFIELAKQLLMINKYSVKPDADMKILDEMCEVFARKYDDLKLDKIPDSEIVLRDWFYEILSSLISEAVLYVSIKSIEEKNDEVLGLLNSLPRLIASRMMLHGIPIKQIKNHLKTWFVLDAFYEISKEISPETYKHLVDHYEKNIDFLLLDAIGGEFSKKITPEIYKQFVNMYEENVDVILSDAMERKIKEKIEQQSIESVEEKRKGLAEKN